MQPFLDRSKKPRALEASKTKFNKLTAAVAPKIEYFFQIEKIEKVSKFFF